ncbi:2,3-bisphosphoglycerate-independent phosphoglycerate mutase [Candidatus Magnetaquicoccus inordinatus]|uniref:2,3-bisphosphoglycerate-independent phosphoglycerate mutase n=1 Tax=Candidatus Magnetaquicoccus inordinatus TaxID=2496818 RepID=UPI00102B0C01|nr:2,3-bisphosphoglycerate-independent phosphoglycerate mutase [Candidatus Magnetaquicoccus inordinatus]
MRAKPVALVVLDGWGINQDSRYNAIHHAATPNYDRWLNSQPHTLVQTSAGDVGLPDGQMGNSEVGHTNLGAGRIVYQDLTRINKAIWDGELASNLALEQSIQTAIEKQSAIHICGLLSPGGIHSHSDHLLAAVLTAKDCRAKKVYIHAILDGRDTPPRSALTYLEEFQRALKRIGCGTIVSLCGRYYAMDRDKRWERVQRAYDMYTLGSGLQSPDPLQAVHEAYQRGEDDEFVQPTLIINQDLPEPVIFQDDDVLLMLNFRADRMREICHALLDPQSGAQAFQGFTRSRQPKLAAMLTMTQYDSSLQPVAVAFPPDSLSRILGEELANAGLRQLRAAETEKYAHVTYFFNGGREESFPGEDRLLIPSPKVATYDLQPEMSAHDLTEQIIARVEQGIYDFIVVNYANPDMVGHTGRFAAAVQAIETVDHCLGRLADTILQAGGELLITADHGNADCMLEEQTQQPHTAHTSNPAPLIYLGKRAITLQPGRLSDIAPTLLELLELPQPLQMTGTSLLRPLPKALEQP